MQLHDVFVQYGYDGATLNHLSAASGLSKASLYHHFPGGKPEMAASLIRQAIAELHRHAFSQLQSQHAPGDRLHRFLDGFSKYCKSGKRNCLLAVINLHDDATGHTGKMQADIAAQFADWHILLAENLKQMGFKPKRARRSAQQIVANLYGGLVLARLNNEPGVFVDMVKLIKKNHPPSHARQN